jgi:SAM-dependent methyltransferase
MSNDFSPNIFHPQYFNRYRLLKYIRQFAPELEGKLLDFGCGTKPYERFFNVTAYIGLDYENEGHPHANEQIDVFYDGKIIPFPDKTFDAVLATEVFEHVFHLEDTLKELNRVLKEGGKMLVTLPFVWYEHEIPYDFARYSSYGIIDLLQRNGFRILKIQKTTNFIETLTQMCVVYLNTNLLQWLGYIPFFGKIIRLTIIGFSNIWGVFLGKILPKRDDWFLNLVIVVVKDKIS